MRCTTHKTYLKFICSAALSASLAICSLSAQIRYQLVEPRVAGNPITKTASYGNMLNIHGETLLNRITTFAVWKDGAVTHIANSATDYSGTLLQVQAASINEHQQVVGSKTYRSSNLNDTIPFYWDPANGLVDLDELGARNLEGVGNTRLYGINRNGESLGTSDLFDGTQRSGNAAFTWSFEQGRVDIPALSSHEGKSFTSPRAINDSGVVAGTYRAFLGSLSVYVERGFVYTETSGSLDLQSLDSDFFRGTHITAADINNASVVVGNIDDAAYLFDLENAEGRFIPAPGPYSRSLRAHSISDSGIVVGTMRTSDELSGKPQISPFFWKEEIGSVDLSKHIYADLSKLIPTDLEAQNACINPKSVNSSGQISATLETGTSFSREVLLLPTLSFDWSDMVQVRENGVSGVLYRHNKGDFPNLIPTHALGYQIGFECSPDMENWQSVSQAGDGIRHLETEDFIELFVPFGECMFLRPVLLTTTSST